jgi:hypothetical protein
VGLPADDVLDSATIARIEELHNAVLEAEAERRFGRRRTHELEDARATEQEFLDTHGFASYNDYRLRIRRSGTAVVAPQAGDRPFVADDNGASVDAALPPGSAHESPAPDGNALPLADGGPERVSEAQDTCASSALSALRPGPLLAAFESGLDEYVARQTELADIKVVKVLDNANRRAADILAHARTSVDDAEALVAEAIAVAERMVAVMDELLFSMPKHHHGAAAALSATMESGSRPA